MYSPRTGALTSVAMSRYPAAFLVLSMFALQPATQRFSRGLSTWLRVGLKNTPGACSSLLTGKIIISVATRVRCTSRAGSAGSGCQTERHQAQEKGLEGDDIRVKQELHGQAAGPDADQQRQHQVIGQVADVAHAIHQEAAPPQSEQAEHHAVAGEVDEPLQPGQEKQDRLGEVAQMPDQFHEQAEVEYPAEQPGPLVRLEQAFEHGDFAHHARRHPQTGGRCRCGRDFQRLRRARVDEYLARHADDEDSRRYVKKQRINHCHSRHR